MILETLKEAHFKVDELKEMKKNTMIKLKKILDEVKYGQDVAFETFLEKLKLAEDQYFKLMLVDLQRSSMPRTKRTPDNGQPCPTPRCKEKKS